MSSSYLPASSIAHPLEHHFLAEAVYEALPQLRNGSDIDLQASPESYLSFLILVQNQLRELLRTATDTPQTRRQAANAVLHSALNDLRRENGQSAALLQRYYVDALSYQQVKNKRRHPESLSTVRRSVQAARDDLAAVLYKQEMLARANRLEALRNKVPLRDVGRLVGRSAEQARLHDLLTRSGGDDVITVVGIGGVGKTALAQAVAIDALAEFRFSDVIWIALDEAPWDTARPSADEAVRFVLDRMVQALAGNALRELDEIEQLRALRDLMTAAPYLVVVDDVHTVAAATGLYLRLMDLAGPSKFLLLSRTNPPREPALLSIPLEPFGRESALAYLRRQRERLDVTSLLQLGDGFLREVVDILGGHPLALRMFVSLSSTYSPGNLLQAFADVDTSQVSALYEVVYSQVWQALGDEARRLLYAITLVSRQGASEGYLQALVGGDRDGLWRAIWQVVGLSLLDRRSVDGEILYYVHHLTERYVLSAWEADDAWSQRDEYVARGLDHWRNAALSTALIDAQQPHIRRLLRVAVTRPALWEDAAELVNHCFPWVAGAASWREWIGIMRLLVEAAPEEPLTLRRQLTSRLGWLLGMEGDYAAAVQIHQQSLALAYQEEDTRAVARENLQLNIDYRGLGDHETSETYGQTALQLFQEADAGPLYLQHAHNGLGLTFKEQRDFPAALEQFQQALACARSVGDWLTTIRIINNVGGCYSEMEDREQACAAFDEALALVREHGGPADLVLVASSYSSVLIEMGETDAARRLLDEAELDGNSPAGTLTVRAMAALLRGRLALAEEDWSEAGQHLVQAEAQYRRLGNWRQLAITLLEQRRYYRAHKEKEAAAAALAEAEALLDERVDAEVARRIRDWFGM